MVHRIVECNVARPAVDGHYRFIGTYLPIRRRRDLWAFLRLSGAVGEQLRANDAVVRYGVGTRFWSLEFWTVSVWADRSAVGRFVRTEPHATAVRRMANWGREGAAFVEWDSVSSTVNWPEVLKRLQQPTRYYRAPLQSSAPPGPS